MVGPYLASYIYIYLGGSPAGSDPWPHGRQLSLDPNQDALPPWVDNELKGAFAPLVQVCGSVCVKVWLPTSPFSSFESTSSFQLLSSN